MGRYVLPGAGRPKNQGLGALPGDFLGSMLEQQVYLRALQKSLRRPGIDLPMDPGGVFVAIGYQLSFVPDAYYPFDPQHVATVRRALDPSFTPIFRKLVYRARTTGGLYVFYHHGIAAFDDKVKDDPLVMAAPRPRWGFGGVRPNHIARWFELPYKRASRNGVPSWREMHALPKPFMPWDGFMLGWAFDTYWDASPEAKWRFIGEQDDARAAAGRAAFEKQDQAAHERGKEELPLQRRLQQELDNPQARREVVGLISGLEHGPTKESVYVSEKGRKTA